MQKVGDRLSKYDIVNEVFDAIGEIAKKSDFISAGLKDQDVYALCKQGHLERVKKGYYKNHSDKMAYFQGKFRIWQSEFKNIENSSFDFSCRDIKHTIQQIKGIISQRPNDNYILVPLNTKLSTIAATLVGIENRRIQLCYAIPEIYNVNNYAMPGDNATIVDLFEFQEFK